MSEQNGGQWLTTSEAAAALCIADKTVRRRIRRGDLKARKVPSGKGGFVWEIAADATGRPLETDAPDSPTDSSIAQPTEHPLTQANTHSPRRTPAPPLATGGEANGEQRKFPPSRVQNSESSDSPPERSERTPTRPTDSPLGQGDSPSGHPTDSPLASADTQRSDARAELLDQLKDENRFLKAQLEDSNRNAAELRAALRKALEIAPRQLPAGTPTAPAPPPDPTGAAPEAPIPPAPQSAAGEAARKAPRPLWKVMLGIR